MLVLIHGHGSSVSTSCNHLIENFDPVALPDPTSFDHPTEHPAAPAQLLLQSLTDLIHPAAGFTGEGDLEQCLSHAEALTCPHIPQVEAPRGDVLLDHPRGKTKVFQRFGVHKQYLASASRPPMRAPFQTAIYDCDSFLYLSHGLPVDHGNKEAQDFSHAVNPLQRGSCSPPAHRYRCGSERQRSEFC